MEKMIPVIIPAYEPDMRLLELLNDMKSNKCGPVILVNDGSGKEYDDIFDKAQLILKDIGGVLLIHEKNQGKGRALKTAFAYVLEQYPQAIGVVTADSDGHHTVSCVNAVRFALERQPDNLILGVRKFDGGNPLEKQIWKYIDRENLCIYYGRACQRYTDRAQRHSCVVYGRIA